MKIISILVSESWDEGIWSISDGHKENEFDKFFDNMNDPSWLFEFFSANVTNLFSCFWKNMTIEDAVLFTIDEARTMEDTLYELAEKGFNSGRISLDRLFRPLNNNEYAIVSHQKSKARVNKGWLRLYGIRLSSNSFLITGGAIKLTRDMRPPHLQTELKKLELAKNFLKNNGIYYPEDINRFTHE